ncbi:MAG: T9SS type A sorting domain-containing protein, partial [Bacteroidota bacterium]
FGQQTTVSAGGNSASTNGSVSFSVGQVAYGSALSTAGNINQGVQQPFEIVTSNGQPIAEQDGWLVFPNPTNGQLTIESSTGTSAFQYSIFDSNGKLVAQQERFGPQAIVDMNGVAPATYLLQINTAERKRISYTIIKNDIR